MAQSSFPFENVDTTETQFSQMFRTLNAGVNGTPAGTELKVTAGTGLQVSVAAGQAMVRGHYYISTAAELLTIGTANPSNPRIDTVVLRLDPVANSIVLAVVAGTAAASPVAPTLTQTDAGTYEFPLANVAVAAGAGTVGTITDRRVFMGKRLQSVGTSAARDIVFPSPVQGDMVWRDDLGAVETYYGLYNASNPGGRDSAGWYTTNRAGGLIPVKPSSVGISGGSATVNAIGEVVFSGTSGLTLNNIFSSSFKNYRIVISGFAPATGTPTILGRYTDTAGTPYSGTTYYDGGVRINAGTVSAVNNTATDRMELLGSADADEYNAITLEIRNPNLAAMTQWQNTGTGWAGGHRETFLGGFYTNPTQFFGIYIYAATGTQIKGSVTVYGYNK